MFTALKEKLSHLPVNSIAKDVAEATVLGQIPVVTSEVASGKTLLIPTALAEVTSNIVYVLEPTRFLSNNAAETMWNLLGKENENLVGCLNSERSDDESILHPENKIVFTTVGFALASGIVHTASCIIFDEAHETSIDLSLAKAIVWKRINVDKESIRTAVLSATIDHENEIDFWGETAQQYTTKGSSYPVTDYHRPGWNLGESVVHLVDDEDKRGVLVFVSGKEEIKDAIEVICHSLKMSGLEKDLDYEIYGIHGGSTGEERRIFSKSPVRRVKIGVGTNVLESGVTLPWVDSGVSSGETKVLHVRGNVSSLQVENLPAWRIRQQMGRVARMRPGTFILADKTPIEQRPEINIPDIVRLPLTELVMHCARLPDINVRELNFSKNEQPKEGAIDRAIQTLVNLGLIVENDGHLSLTEDGRLTEILPLGHLASAAFAEAYTLDADRVQALLPLIAMIDVGDIRHDFRISLGGDKWDSSDLINSVYVVAQMRAIKNSSNGSLREIAELHNVSMKRYREYTNLLQIIETKTKMRADYRPYLSDDKKVRSELDLIAKRIILRAMINTRYDYSELTKMAHVEMNHPVLGVWKNLIQISNTSVCHGRKSSGVICTGNVRRINPKNGRPFSVLENVTLFTKDDVRSLAKHLGSEKIDPNRVASQKEEKYESDLYPEYSGHEDDRYKRRRAAHYDVSPKKEEKKNGTFGDLLLAAMNKK